MAVAEKASYHQFVLVGQLPSRVVLNLAIFLMTSHEKLPEHIRNATRLGN